VLPLKPKPLLTELRARGIGRVTPLKRGAHFDTDAWLKGLKLSGDRHALVLFARPAAILAERLDS
jgi:hypothetical protein